MDYEKALRHLFCYYVSSPWFGGDEVLPWERVQQGNVRMSFTQFLRFAADFKLYPALVPNDISNGFLLLSLFLGGKQGNRVGVKHDCSFPRFADRCTICGDHRHALARWEVSRARHAFELWDKDGNGTLEAADLLEVLQDMGRDPTEEELNKMLAEMDPDCSGTVTFSEFLAGMLRGETLKARAANTSLTLSEFVQVLALCAKIGFANAPQMMAPTPKAPPSGPEGAEGAADTGGKGLGGGCGGCGGCGGGGGTSSLASRRHTMRRLSVQKTAQVTKHHQVRRSL
jgi:hypothetical protein